jgi:hypothetical protein
VVLRGVQTKSETAFQVDINDNLLPVNLRGNVGVEVKFS